LNTPTACVQAPRQMASHEPETDESNSDVSFLELCWWSAHSVSPWSTRCLFTDGDGPAAMR
jgi:hypothetical protein